MEGHLLIVEIAALTTGLAVITIEVVIIVMLRNHIKALNSHFDGTDQLIARFENEINGHLEHLNEHSHKIETMLHSICDHEEGLHERGSLKRVVPAGKERPSEVLTVAVG